MRYSIIDSFFIGNNTAVTLDAYNIGVDIKKPLIDDHGNEHKILGVGMLAGDEPGRKYPLDILVQGKISCQTVDITEA